MYYENVDISQSKEVTINENKNHIIKEYNKDEYIPKKRILNMDSFNDSLFKALDHIE